MASTAFIKIKDPGMFFDWLLDATKQPSVTRMFVKAGFSNSYGTCVKKTKMISYASACVISQKYNIPISKIREAASCKKENPQGNEAKKNTKEIPAVNLEQIAKSNKEWGVMIIELLKEQNQLLKNIGIVLTNIETITENTWK